MPKPNEYLLEEKEIKNIRRQANRLATVVRNLRQMADERAKTVKRMRNAEKTRVNFFSKQSKIDPSLTLTPDLSKDDPLELFENGVTVKQLLESLRAELAATSALLTEAETVKDSVGILQLKQRKESLESKIKTVKDGLAVAKNL